MTDIQIGTTPILDFVLVDNTGIEVPGLGAVFTVLISKNGGAFAASAGAKAEIGSGWYSYTLTDDETDTTGPLALAISGVGTVQQNLLFTVVGYVIPTVSVLTSATGGDYCSLGEFKERFFPDGSADVADDWTIESIIGAVSREIDKYCKRRFYKNSTSEARYFTAAWGNLLFCDDVVSVTGVDVDDDGDRTYGQPLVVTTDYDLEPYNAFLDDQPYTRLRIAPNSSHAFSTAQKGNRLTGIFGWPSIPQEVHEACLIQSIRLFKRKDAPFGVAGTGEMGQVVMIASLDPDVKLLLDPLKKGEVIW